MFFKLQPMETSTLIFCQLLPENILYGVCNALVFILFYLHSNSCGISIYLSDNEWVMLCI